MNKYTYWSNKKSFSGEELFSVEAKNIVDADKMFEEATGINPMKSPWVGVTIIFSKNSI